MITEWELYWLFRLDSIKEVLTGLTAAFGAFCIIATIAFVIGSICVHVEGYEEGQVVLKKLRLPLIILDIFFVFIISANVLCPTTKEMAVIFVAPKVINSEFVQDDAPEEAKEIYGLFKSWLRGQAGEKEKP